MNPQSETKQWRVMLGAIRLQLVIACLIGTVFAGACLGIIPKPAALVSYLEIFFDRYGLLAVATCSMLENVPALNVYFPGSLVILTAMALTAGRPLAALVVFLTICAFSILAHIVTFLVTRKLRGPASGQEVGGPGMLSFFGSFWHPHFAAILSLRCGASGMAFRRFLARVIVAALPWYAFWAIVMYSVGTVATSGGYPVLIGVFVIYLLGWTMWDLRKVCRRNPGAQASPGSSSAQS